MKKVSYPGEANAAYASTEHVCQHGREWLRRWKVGKKMRTLPVGDLETKNKYNTQLLSSKAKKESKSQQLKITIKI